MLTWLINYAAYALLLHLNPQAATLAQTYFNTPDTYFIVTGATNPSNIPKKSRPTLSFASYAAMQAAFSSGSVGPNISAVIYDNEYWPQTPVGEQQNPALYYKQAAALAHAHGLQLIAAPATDLVSVLSPGFTGNRYTEFVRLGIAGAAAKYADIYEIQAQGTDTNVNQYTSFVEQAASQARAANPKVTVLAGLSTKTAVKVVTAAQLFAAVQATSGVVSGYWMNIPGQSVACPSCGVPQPAIAQELLQLVSNAGKI